MLRTLNKIINSTISRSLREYLILQKYLLTAQAMKKELSKVPIVKSGFETINGKQLPFVVLENKTVLYGRFPSNIERQIYHRWKRDIVSTVSEDTILVAMDVVLRYLYPHAMPHLTMPYARNQRRYFHKQHSETIRDLPGLTNEQKSQLLNRFAIRRDETFLDIGAYMGYGVIRMTKELGPDSRIFAVEADPESYYLLEQNIKVNKLSNVTSIPKAISNRNGTASFYKTSRQANSLISEVVNTKVVVQIPVTSIDSLLKDTGVDSINRISITINGAEVEAVEGMMGTVEKSKYLRISLAGWYKRDGCRIADIVMPVLHKYGLDVAIGHEGGVLAWKGIRL